MSRGTTNGSVNFTALRTEIAPLWVSSPDGRGTWDILYTCIFTILLCVYTAIHLNVPPPDDTKKELWLRKTKWVAIAIFAPEIVVVNAFLQWKMARDLVKELKDIAKDSDDAEFQASIRPRKRIHHMIDNA